MSTESALAGKSGKHCCYTLQWLNPPENFISFMFTIADPVNAQKTECLLDGLALQILFQNIRRKVKG